MNLDHRSTSPDHLSCQKLTSSPNMPFEFKRSHHRWESFLVILNNSHKSIQTSYPIFFYNNTPPQTIFLTTISPLTFYWTIPSFFYRHLCTYYVMTLIYFVLKLIIKNLTLLYIYIYIWERGSICLWFISMFIYIDKGNSHGRVQKMDSVLPIFNWDNQLSLILKKGRKRGHKMEKRARRGTAKTYFILIWSNVFKNMKKTVTANKKITSLTER